MSVAGSSRRKAQTLVQASRRTRAHSLPCWEPICSISPPVKVPAEMLVDWVEVDQHVPAV